MALDVDAFLDRWFIPANPDPEVREFIKAKMKADLEEMLMEAKRSGAIFAGPSPNIYL